MPLGERKAAKSWVMSHINVDCSMSGNVFNRFIPNRLSIRHSWDFSISSDCRGYFFGKSFHNPRTSKIPHEPQIFTSACSQNHKFIDHVFLARLLLFRIFSHWITWKCVNEFSLRETTLTSSLVSWAADEIFALIKLRCLVWNDNHFTRHYMMNIIFWYCWINLGWFGKVEENACRLCRQREK